MAGSIALSGVAALRSGAGLVTIAAPDAVVDVVATFHPCFMTIPLPSDSDGKIGEAAIEKIQTAIENASCVAIGPGLGRSTTLDSIIGELLSKTSVPLVVDADGINAVKLAQLDVAGMAGPRVFTPHPGEFERLTGVSAKNRKDQTDAAIQLAADSNWTVVLKGHHTLVTDRRHRFVNQTGNPKMAVGGAGDCLTGIIAALIAQGMPPYEASVLGVAVHGRAGDIAAERLPGPSVLATDIIDHLPFAFQWALTAPRMA